jgi:hypothetical protein
MEEKLTDILAPKFAKKMTNLSQSYGRSYERVKNWRFVKKSASEKLAIRKKIS